MRKQPGFMKTGDEFSFFSKSQQSLNPWTYVLVTVIRMLNFITLPMTD